VPDLPPPLTDAVDALRRDLADPAREPLLQAAAAERVWWLSEWPDGAPLVLCLLAQDLQEAMHEAADPTWPRCREHGDHPLLVEPDLGPDPFWVCSRSGLPFAAVGMLRGAPGGRHVDDREGGPA